MNVTEAEAFCKHHHTLNQSLLPPVFLIDSPWSCAARWHDIWDYEAGRAALFCSGGLNIKDSLVSSKIRKNEKTKLNKTKKVITGRQSSHSTPGRFKSAGAAAACCLWTLILGHLISQPKTHTQLERRGGVTYKADCYHNNPVPACDTQRLLDEMW